MQFEKKCLAKAEIKKAESALAVVKSKLIPNVGVKAAWIYDKSGENTTHGAMLGASLNNIPLVYQYRPEIERAKLEIKKAKLAYRDLEIDATRELFEVWEHYHIARNNLNFYNKELQANSEELERVSMDNLKKNKISMTDFLVTKQRYIELLINYNDAFTNYYTTYARLLKEIDVKDIELVKNKNL